MPRTSRHFPALDDYAEVARAGPMHRYDMRSYLTATRGTIES
jgi:hypothetical protein